MLTPASPKDQVLFELLKGYGPRLAPPRTWEWLAANRGQNAVAIQGPGCFFALPVEPAASVKVCLLREPRTFVTIPAAHQCFWIVANRSGLRFLRICGDRSLEKIHLAAPDSPVFHEAATCLVSVLGGETRKGAASWEKQTRGVAAAMQLFLLAWEISRPAANDDLTTRRSRRRDEAVAALHEWFAHHLSRPLKLEDAAAHFHASPRQLLRMLKEASGFGFTDHLVLHRLLQAREWLMTRARASVSEVAAGVGFTSREAFIRRFRATFGLPPLQFRKQWESASDHPGVLPTVTRFLGRAPVLWFKILPATPPQPDPHARPHTLVISNALETIVEIFAIGPTGQRTREAVLERGAMHAIHHDRAGSQWAAVRTATGQQAIFVTPADHCLAIIEPTCFG